MKIKKFFASVLLVFTLIAGGLAQAQPVAAALSKKQVVSIIKKDNQNAKSGKLTTNIESTIKKDKLYTNFDFIFNADKKLVHQVGTIQYQNKKVNADVWYDIPANRVYINNNGKWEYKKVDFGKVNTKSNTALSASQFKKLVSDGKLKHQGASYTISSKLKIKKYLKQYLRAINNGKLRKKDIKYIKNNVKISSIPISYTVKDKKFVFAKIKYTGTINKELKMKVNMSIGNFGEYETLTLPEETKNAVEADDD